LGSFRAVESFGGPTLYEGDAISEKRHTLDDLIQIMARLRSEKGCPWDREQTISSLRSFLLEEAYELLDAIDQQDRKAQSEELGDVLFQIVFQSQIAAEEGWFDIQDVIHGIAEKLIRRHPHVFGTEKAETCAEVIDTWDKLKKEEKHSKSVLDGVPRSLPALLQTHRLSDRAARVGFDWKKPEQVLEKMREEFGELLEALEQPDTPEKAAWELGDLLFATTNLARHLGLCAEDLLREANRRFSDRFRLLESLARERQVDIKSADIQTLESLWQEAKSKLSDH
jgi:tetrapyrrole methylase family protein/MazG family protein